ncbi:sigma-54 interaction domain-containing protein [Vibrio rumoiensis]|uniref:Sigma-54 interaction domain-containing protein n=1 Tax=Vibrio rumoiensis TaxID=76258 RepID=A0ABW7IYE1_9VIBR
MSPWLVSITELMKLRDASSLSKTFINCLTQTLDISQSFILELSDNGRELIYNGHDEGFTWSVMDFDTPFAHVLHDNKHKLILQSELIYWQGNNEFKKLASQLRTGQACLIYPLSCAKESGPSLLVLFGDSDNLEKIKFVSEFKLYVDAYGAQWKLLKDLKKVDLEKQTLSETLTIERKVSQQSQKLLDLSSTLIGGSSAMVEVKKKIVAAAESPLSVMIHGDTGTGKEVVAKAIHQISSYNKGQFIAINCSAIPENLLESELFGYEKGAFSGADSYHAGLIEQADQGTLFLDEIGDMPVHLQSKLLRVIETKSFRPLGGKKELTSNFRLISATHINLKEKIKAKEFRPDLYYRLMQCPISLPALIERKDDIEILSEYFIDKYNESYQRDVGYLTRSSLDYLKKLEFPGNVRELKSMIDLSCSQVEDGQPISLSCIADNSNALSLFDNDDVILDSRNLDEILNEFESKVINGRLKTCLGNKTKTAKSLGIPLRTLTYKCQKLEIS